MNKLITPFGGKLINLLVSPTEAAKLYEQAVNLPSLQLTERQVCDLELLATGAFSPLDRFMSRADYQSMLDEMRLESGHIFPVPVTLSVNCKPKFSTGDEIVLRDEKNEILALMEIEGIFDWDQKEAARKVFGTQDTRHPLVAEMNRWGKFNLSGKLRVLHLPRRFDFQNLRLSPYAVRERLSRTKAA